MGLAGWIRKYNYINLKEIPVKGHRLCCISSQVVADHPAYQV
jgi:hypothetical protein